MGKADGNVRTLGEEGSREEPSTLDMCAFAARMAYSSRAVLALLSLLCLTPLCALARSS